MMQLIKKLQCISLIVFMTGFVLFSSQVYAYDLFGEYQSIPTHGATDWEHFTIGSDTYLAVANCRNDVWIFNIDSKMYKWNGYEFKEFQSIPTKGAADWEHFTIGSDTFLAVANSHDGFTANIDSKIYKWNGNAFVEHQSIPTQGAWDWESFTIGSDTFLAVANAWDGTIFNIDSKIYKWNGYEFEEFQSIPTNEGADWESFTIGSDTFLAVANYYNGDTHNINSTIYKWNGDEFELFQSIPTQGAFVWEYFTIGSDPSRLMHFLAVANRNNGDTTNIDSMIYKWNGYEFEEFQSIPTNEGVDWESFTIGSDTFLAVANLYNDGTYNIESKIYKYGRTGAFVEYQSIPTHGAVDWKYFTIGSDPSRLMHFLAVANWYNDATFNIDSKIYRAAPYAVRVPSEQAPTIRAAIDLVADGGRVSIEPGVYEIQEPITIQGKTVIIEGAGSSRNPKPGKLTQLVAPPPTEVADPEVATGIFNFIGAGGVIKDMDISGGDAAIVGRNDDGASENLDVEDVEISNTGRGILWKVPSDIAIKDVSIHNCLHNGLSVASPPPFITKVEAVDTFIGDVKNVPYYFKNCVVAMDGDPVHGGKAGGLVAINCPYVTLRNLDIHDNHIFGIGLFWSTAWITDCHITRTYAIQNEPDDLWGDGLQAWLSSVYLDDMLIDHNDRAAVANFGSFVSMGWSEFECQPIDMIGDPVPAHYFGFNLPPEVSMYEFVKHGDVLCGCPEAMGDCLKKSGTLSTPPPALPEE